jgi:hypothetical protein
MSRDAVSIENQVTCSLVAMAHQTLNVENPEPQLRLYGRPLAGFHGGRSQGHVS